MKQLDWNDLKNEQLRAERLVCFDDVLAAIEACEVLGDIPHPNHEKYLWQRILIVSINHYAYLVPYVEDTTKIFLKTVIPNRRATKYYLG